MNDPLRSVGASFSGADLKRRRELIRRGLLRANTAAAVILLIVMGLSLAALLQAFRAERNSRTAEEASTRAQDELWRAQLARAHAQRLSGLAGRKPDGLAAVAAAAAIRPALDLRDEAIAALALTDVTDSGLWRAVSNFTAYPSALTQDLDRYAVGDGRGTVTLYGTSDGKTLARFQGPPSMASNLRFSPDDQWLAAAFQNGDVVIWQLTNNAPWLTWTCGNKEAHPTKLSFSPEGRALAVSCGTTQVRFIDLVAKDELLAIDLDTPGDEVDFRPDGKMLALSVSNRIELRHWPTRTLAQTLPHAGKIVTFAWNPDSRRLASSSWDGSEIILWDTLTTNHWSLRGHAELVPHLVFDHLGDLLVSFSWDGSTRWWRATDGELLLVSRAGFGLAFNQDDTKLAYMREMQGFGIWNVSQSSVYRELPLPVGATRYITGFDFSPDGQQLAVVNPDALRLFDLNTGRERSFVSASNVLSVWFTARGEKAMTVARNQITLWRTPTSEQTQWIEERKLDLPANMVLDFGTVTRATTPLVAVPASDNVFWIDLGNPLSVSRLSGDGKIGPLTGAAISPDTNWVATTYWKDRGTFVWDTRTQKRTHALGPSGGFVAFSPNNRWLLVGSAHQYSLWDTKDWRLARQFERRTAGELVGTGAFSADSRLVAICPEVNSVQLIETESGRVLASLNAPVLRNIGWVMFSPNGKSLAASTFDNKIQLWDLPMIQHELAAFGLGWSSSETSGPAQTAPVESRIPGVSPTRRLGAKAFYMLDGFGVLAAMMIGFYTLRYHQRMVGSYEEIESLVAQRNRELEVAQVELLHSQKMKALGTLAAGIAHDFNNLLSVVRMGNNFLGRTDTTPEEKAESSAAIERAVEQGKKVVRSMLGYSREQNGGAQLYSVPDVVDEVVLLLSKEFLGGLTLTLEVDRDIPQVRGARGRLEQILLNLVVNAAEAMNGKGRLRIGVRVAEVLNGEFVLRPKPAARFVELTVTDTGPGVEASIRHRIFEPFFSTKPQSAGSGTGLGLSLMHSLAEQEGMGICLNSAPGHGAKFTVLIPANCE